MLILLPPSETKRPGGSGGPLTLDTLSFPALSPQREQALHALAELARDGDEMARVLKLSARQLGEIDVNRHVVNSPTMPAMDRFTGVLYDALDASSLDPQARDWLGEHVVIQTALLGPVGAADLIPAFRLSAGNKLPGLAPLKKHWADASSVALIGQGPVLDMRSEAYRALAPVPAGEEHGYVRVVNGEGRALNHFNKQSKGVFARALALSGERFDGLDDLIDWACARGFDLVRDDTSGELVLGEVSSMPEMKSSRAAG